MYPTKSFQNIPCIWLIGMNESWIPPGKPVHLPRMTAAAAGFSMPPEWSPQEAVWLSWPVEDPRHWGGAKREMIWAKFAEIAAAISRFEPVRINAPGADHAAIAAACNRAKAVPERVQLFDHPHNDVWCRDHGPIFVKHATTGEVAVTDWEFNAWGGKFPPWDLDNAIPGRIAASLGKRCFKGGMILEGGAIEINGAGQLLTTEAVLLNPNRNPDLSREEIEQLLRDGLGVSEILWLKQGIEGDDTDGHIDDLARFIDPQTILACIDTTGGAEPTHPRRKPQPPARLHRAERTRVRRPGNPPARSLRSPRLAPARAARVLREFPHRQRRRASPHLPPAKKRRPRARHDPRAVPGSGNHRHRLPRPRRGRRHAALHFPTATRVITRWILS